MRVSLWGSLGALASCVLGQENPILATRDIEVRQQAGTTANAANFLRRAYHGCEYFLVSICWCLSACKTNNSSTIAVVAGNFVYIDGGAFSYSSGGSPVYEYCMSLQRFLLPVTTLICLSHNDSFDRPLHILDQHVRNDKLELETKRYTES